MLEGFRHIAARRISGMTFRSTEGVEQEYPPVVDAMDPTGPNHCSRICPYLGCTIGYNNRNWAYVYHNLRKG